MMDNKITLTHFNLSKIMVLKTLRVDNQIEQPIIEREFTYAI